MTQKRVPLGNFVTEYSVRNKNNEDIPVYSVTNSQGFCREYFGKEVASKDKTTYKIVPYGCFAYNPSRINVGSVDWQRCEAQVIVSPLYNVFSVSDELDRQFLYYFLKSNIGRQMIRAKAAGSVRDNLKLDMLKEMTIPDSSLDDQRHCVATLDNLQYLIELRKKQLNELDNLIKARFIELFGDPDENPMKWETTELDQHLDIVGGFTFKSDGFADTGIPVLRIGNINSGHFLPVNMVFWPDDPMLARYKMYPGDLVMSLTGTVGKDDYGNVCILSDEYSEYYLNQRNAKLAIKATLNKHYLSEMLKFSKIKKRLTGISRGVRQANISNKDILALCVPIPPITLQEQFAAFVEQTDKSKVVVQKALDEAQTLFDSLMQEYFR